MKFVLTILLALFPLSSVATTYYLSATGNDGNSGLTSSAPWLTPNHPVNCGDTILAAASTAYFNGNLQSWGNVTCPGNNSVAWLQCVAFDACKVIINDTNHNSSGIIVNHSYWGVQGFEVDDTASGGYSLSCFGTYPATATIHHIIFANNIANTCPLAAFGGGSAGRNGTDYLNIIGNIAYNAGTTNYNCGSNIDVFSPVASDSLPGTHIYVAGNFSFHSANPAYENCYDGDGIIFDTFDGNTTPGIPPYTAQAVIANNFSLSNGGSGILLEYDSPYDYGATTPPVGVGQSAIYVMNNTLWGNSTGIGPTGGYAYGSSNCGEYRVLSIQNTHASGNLAVTNAPQCYGWVFTMNYQLEKPNDPVYANWVDATSTFTGNWLFNPYGPGTNVLNSPTFVPAANTIGTDPQLAAPFVPPAPSCGGYPDVPHCMASIVTNFKPQNSAAQAYGYQVPRTGSTYDALFPQWLCNANLPQGLVTMGCSPAVTTSRGVTRIGTITR